MAQKQLKGYDLRRKNFIYSNHILPQFTIAHKEMQELINCHIVEIGFDNSANAAVAD